MNINILRLSLIEPQYFTLISMLTKLIYYYLFTVAHRWVTAYKFILHHERYLNPFSCTSTNGCEVTCQDRYQQSQLSNEPRIDEYHSTDQYRITSYEGKTPNCDSSCNSIISHGWLRTLKLSKFKAKMPTFFTSITVASSKQINISINISSHKVNDVLTAIIIATVATSIAASCWMAYEKLNEEKWESKDRI